MKQGKSLKREFKEVLSSHGLFPNHWLLLKEMEFHLKLINKDTGKIKFIDKFKRGKRRERYRHVN